MRVDRWAGTCKALKAKVRSLLLTSRSRRNTNRYWEGKDVRELRVMLLCLAASGQWHHDQRAVRSKRL